jgi:hypothetical protein
VVLVLVLVGRGRMGVGMGMGLGVVGGVVRMGVRMARAGVIGVGGRLGWGFRGWWRRMMGLRG